MLSSNIPSIFFTKMCWSSNYQRKIDVSSYSESERDRGSLGHVSPFLGESASPMGGLRRFTFGYFFFCHKKFIKVKGDVSEPNHLGCAKELTAPTDPRQCRFTFGYGNSDCR